MPTLNGERLLPARSTPMVATPASDIHRVILRYAEAYAALQHIQESSPLIPIGDQKTGSIGEFYVRLYLEARHPYASIRYGGHSESGWDLEVGTPERAWRVQVKTVSAFASMRRISPIKQGWDELYVMHLDRTLSPNGLWIIPDASCMQGHATIKSRCCPNPVTGAGGSKAMDFGANRVGELMSLIGHHLEPG